MRFVEVSRVGTQEPRLAREGGILPPDNADAVSAGELRGRRGNLGLFEEGRGHSVASSPRGHTAGRCHAGARTQGLLQLCLPRLGQKHQASLWVESLMLHRAEVGEKGRCAQ